VQLVNELGEQIKVGFIHGDVLSPEGVTVMVEGTTKDGLVFRYLQPNLFSGETAHHLLVVWDANQVRVKVDYTIWLDPIPITTKGIQWNFAGAGRYKGDTVSVNLKDINFSWGSVNPAPPPDTIQKN
jgi:hypothetical protein